MLIYLVDLCSGLSIRVLDAIVRVDEISSGSAPVFGTLDFGDHIVTYSGPSLQEEPLQTTCSTGNCSKAALQVV